jgi:hypothetical protein
MSALDRIAFMVNRRDEVPNQELARQLAKTKDRKGIAEIADNLWNKNKSIRSDCLKVLYEIGYISPELIADQVDNFLKLLSDKENRMIWGAMIGLSTIADRKAGEIWARISDVKKSIDEGSLITHVFGVRTVARVAASNPSRAAKLMPYLLGIMRTCIPRDVPTHAESMLCAVSESNKAAFLKTVESRIDSMTPSQASRMRRVLRKLG